MNLYREQNVEKNKIIKETKIQCQHLILIYFSPKKTNETSYTKWILFLETTRFYLQMQMDGLLKKNINSAAYMHLLNA